MDLSRKKIALTAILTVTCVIVLVVFFLYWPPVKDEEGSGTIGRAKKYYAQQMSDNDVILRNALSSDKGRVKQSYDEINEYKGFVSAFDTDLGNWIKQLTLVEARRKEKEFPNETLDKITKSIESFKKARMFIAEKRGIVDTTLDALNMVIKSDTMNKSIPVENILLDYFKFENGISVTFIRSIALLPEVNTILKKYGERTILIDFDEILYAQGKEQQVKFNNDQMLKAYNAVGNVTILFSNIEKFSFIYNKSVGACVMITEKGYGPFMFNNNNFSQMVQNKDNLVGAQQASDKIYGEILFFATKSRDNFSSMVHLDVFSNNITSLGAIAYSPKAVGF
jgi:hypothetical protein